MKPLEVFSNRLSDNIPIKINFRFVGEIHKEDPTYTSVIIDWESKLSNFNFNIF